MYTVYSPNEVIICHHGILGQKWGVRRFQNPDGSLTPEGKKRYLGSNGKLNEAGQKYVEKLQKKENRWLASTPKTIKKAHKSVLLSTKFKEAHKDAVDKFNELGREYIKNAKNMTNSERQKIEAKLTKQYVDLMNAYAKDKNIKSPYSNRNVSFTVDKHRKFVNGRFVDVKMEPNKSDKLIDYNVKTNPTVNNFINAASRYSLVKFALFSYPGVIVGKTTNKARIFIKSKGGVALSKIYSTNT